MSQKYSKYFILLIFSFVIGYASAQSRGPQITNGPKNFNSTSIEGLSIYPNPVFSNSKLNIETSKNTSKDIELYNMVGKRMFSISTASRDFMLPNSVTAGVYIIKVKENDLSATRKIVVK